MVWGRQKNRYQVLVESEFGNYLPGVSFRNLDQVKCWIANFDPEGLVGIIVLDHHEGVVVELYEEESEDVDWEQEGF